MSEEEIKQVKKALARIKYLIGLSLDAEDLEEDYKIVEKAIMTLERKKK